MQERQQMKVRTTVNGQVHELLVAPNETLLEMIRNQLGLKGAKLACDMEVCGACTVLLDGNPISSCTTLAIEARDKEVLTIEGLSSGEDLHPIQEAFVKKAGLQCGFCTPGMILTSKALLEENSDPSEEEISAYMDGNICRCTGYKMIMESILEAAKKL
jgi:carbon-monoxide dehydrogenase small subunit